MDRESAIKMFSMQVISNVTGIPYMKIRNNIKGVYNSLTDEEKETIKQTIEDHAKAIF